MNEESAFDSERRHQDVEIDAFDPKGDPQPGVDQVIDAIQDPVAKALIKEKLATRRRKNHRKGGWVSDWK